MGEEAPEPGDFENWLKPSEALKLLPDEWGHGHSINAILTCLQIGTLRAVARAGQIMTLHETKQVEFHPVPSGYWDEGFWTMGPQAFWVTGQVSFHSGSTTGPVLSSVWREHVFTDVRFDPLRFAPALGVGPAIDTDAGKPLPAAQAERFARAILHGWPDITEREAHGKAVLFFPDNKVSRDPFLKIFRSIRGDKPPGKQRSD